MARRGFFRRVARRARTAVRRIGRRSTGGVNPLLTIGTGLAYGATRAPIVGAIRPLTNFLPFGSYNDELVLGAVGWLGMKQANQMIKEAGHTVLAVESFSVGATATAGMTGTSSSGAWSGAYG